MQLSAPDSSSLATVSPQFAGDWISALRRCCTDGQLESFLQRAGLHLSAGQLSHRVTLDQIVRLYQIAAVETKDEMTGLWSRPVRPRALQHLLTTVREAGTLPAALHRFSTFWNLLLDDYRIDLTEDNATTGLQLVPQGAQPVQRFGHMLILKLAHGLLSWLAGYEVPVRAVHFAFERPGFAQDYAAIFPAPVRFEAPCSAIVFETGKLGLPGLRSNAELNAFLARAPRDWIFTRFREHTQSLKVREFLFQTSWESCQLPDAAKALNVTPRTLMRRLEAEETSFQAIKDGLRRDLAIRDLQTGKKSIEEISQDVGFSSAANFHRAFRRWTGAPPSSYKSPSA
ncbi:AraC family transcriptional regulator [Leisingera daeponensis]|uniref:AraC family transcriptional regulator n=1 Tax=Leisingera daeponensis TaxID=405746 RepID=A0ABS7NBE3_9RHOB|nr:AraC family transcriptional regulator [Leisingera daeponensis]MBY6055089.1 AraC family transcriptional regulator [Leisingera daeponensis]MBY6138084.1 AraC family transcriptional regulator [Leisingera daeponensis]